MVGVWLHRSGDRPGSTVPGVLSGRGESKAGRGQPAGRGAHLAHDRADAIESGLRRGARGQATFAGYRRNAVHQLGRQAVLDGAARVAVRPTPLCTLATCRPTRQLRRRPNPACGGAVHCDGICVEQPVGRRSQLHADTSGAKRRDHAVRIRPAGRITAGSLGHHRAMGDTRHVCAALHPGAGRRCPMVAAKPSGRR